MHVPSTDSLISHNCQAPPLWGYHDPPTTLVLVHTGNTSHRSDVLARFSVLAVQYQSLLEQLRPLLKLFVVQPKSVNAHNATSML